MSDKKTAPTKATAAKATTAPAPAAETKDNGITGVTTAVPMPEIKNNRGSKSKYPFDQLTAVGMSFGVKGKTAASLASVVSGQNRKNKSEKKDAEGNTVFKTITQTNQDGSTMEIPDTSKPEMVVNKKFYAADCDPATDPDGASVRIFRSV